MPPSNGRKIKHLVAIQNGFKFYYEYLYCRDPKSLPFISTRKYFFLKKYFLPERLTISLPSFSNPIQSRAILKGS